MTLSLPSPFRTACDAALNFFYPPVCQICREERATAAEGFVGPNCWSEVQFVTAPFCDRCGLPFDGEITHSFQCANCQDMKLHFTSARSAVLAKGLLLDVIHRYKYNRALWFEPFLTGLLISQAAPILAAEKWELLVPVPLYSVRKREREFNQAARLATQLGRAAQIPVNEHLLRRVKQTTTQTRLTRQQRADNVRHAFAFCGKDELQGQKIVLLDDVLTTGATTNACAETLRKAGAGEICVWTVARAVP
jgi:competence protein ComFC